MHRKPSLGDQELELLRYVDRSGPVSVGQAVEGYGVPRGLTRSTINTTIERLYKKGYLNRGLDGDVYRYAAAVTPAEVEHGLVEQFVETTLGGSTAPFVAYFARRSRLTAEQQAELERVVARLEAQHMDKEAEE